MENTDVTYFCLFSPTGRQNVRDYVLTSLLTVLSIPHFSTELVADSLARPLDPVGDIIAAVVEASVVACGGYMDFMDLCFAKIKQSQYFPIYNEWPNSISKTTISYSKF